MADALGTYGAHVIHEDFYGSTGKLQTSGVGTEVITYTTDETDGIINLETGASDGDTAVIEAGAVFAPATNGPMALEARVKMPAITNMAAFVGFSNQSGGTDEVVENGTLDGGVTDAAGLYFEAGVDADQWNEYIATGSAETQQNLVTEAITADEWQVIRVEIDPNGTVRTYIADERGASGVGEGSLRLIATRSAAVSTTNLLRPMVYAATTTTALKQVEVDYFHFNANRDWAVG